MTITHICHHNPAMTVLTSDWLLGSHPGFWLVDTDLTSHQRQLRDGGRQTCSRSSLWWHQAVESWSKSELMIIAIIIFLRPKVVQSISQMLISRCAWFIGHATNWAFYQETKCGNTKILYILFIQIIKGYLWVYGLSWKSKMIATLFNYSLQLGSENVITWGLSG